MNPTSRIPDDAGDRQTQIQLERWFGEPSRVPPLRDGFVQSLSKQLDATFAQAHAAPSPESATEVALESANGIAHGIQKVRDAGPRNPETIASATAREVAAHSTGLKQSTHPEPATRQQSTRQRIMRPRLWAAVAASVLVVVGLWGNRPGYSFARMLQALDEQTWLQCETVGTTLKEKAFRVRRWVSVVYGVDAVSSDKEMRYTDRDEAVTLVYRPGEGESGGGRIISQPAKTDSAATATVSPRTALLSYLLPENDDTRGGSSDDVVVSKQSWRRIAGEQGEPLIELSVSLTAEGKTHRWRLWLNPETHLPVAARKLTAESETDGTKPAESSSAPEEIRFSYPQQGPDSIYSLGVPEETQVVSLRANETPPESVLAADLPRNRMNGELQQQLQAKPNGVNQFVDPLPGDQPMPELPRPEQPMGAKSMPNQPLLAAASRPSESPAEIAPEALERAQKPPKPKPPLGPALAAEALTDRINALLEERWREQGIVPVGRSSDAEFLRRVYLDLVGRIPTVGEARQFLEKTALETTGAESASEQGGSAKIRAALVDELLASRDHATHLAAVWRRVLIPDSVDLTPYNGAENLDQWLADRFQTNLPYDELTRELLLAEGRISESGPLLFYAALKMNAEEIASQASRTFLGMKLDCAMCHDHPFDDRLSQEDFWGFAALFAQISRPRGKIEVVSPVMRVFDNRRGEVMLPDTDVIVPPRLPLSDLPVDQSADAPPRRHQFVDWLVDPHNARYAQATVNRVWAHLFGRGLVEPVDDIRPENPAIHPKLFELLSRDFARSGFDLRRLLRQMVLSDAYQLTSQSEDDLPERTLCFAQMNIKSLTAEQLHDCIAVATRAGPTQGANRMGLSRIGNSRRDAFIALFAAPGSKPVDFHAGIPQALTLMHGGLTDAATQFATSGLLKSINAPFFSDQQRIETLFLATLSRMPTAEESEKMGSYLSGAEESDERLGRLGDMLWALLNSAEFTLNH